MYKEFKVISKERLDPQAYNAPDWTWAYTVKANDHEEAAEKWAEEDDQGGSYSIVGSGEHGPVKVLCLDGIVKEFTIYAESCPAYSATRTSTPDFKIEVKDECPPHDWDPSAPDYNCLRCGKES